MATQQISSVRTHYLKQIRRTNWHTYTNWRNAVEWNNGEKSNKTAEPWTVIHSTKVRHGDLTGNKK